MINCLSFEHFLQICIHPQRLFLFTHTSSSEDSWSTFIPSDRLPLNLSSSLLCRRLRSLSLDTERRYCRNLPYRSLSSDLEGRGDEKVCHPVESRYTESVDVTRVLPASYRGASAWGRARAAPWRQRRPSSQRRAADSAAGGRPRAGVSGPIPATQLIWSRALPVGRKERNHEKYTFRKMM